MIRSARESGQVLVLVALGLLVLVGTVALAVDVGNLYQQRRFMQNAADAGALAGAGELCYGSGEEDAAIARATDYAVLDNGADSALVTITDQITVSVAVTKTAGLFLTRILGFEEADVRADAAAICGAAVSGVDLWPVGFSLDEFQNLYADGNGCGHSFEVWTSDKVVDCREVNCDFDGDGIDDIIIGGDRGYLDFSAARYPFVDDCDSGQGCGSDELACRFRGDGDNSLQLPTCVAGVGGVRASMKDDVDSRIDDTVHVPLYENLACDPEMTNNCTNGVNYWVTRFGCVKVEGWRQGSLLDPSVKVIKVQIDCNGCADPIGTAVARVPEDWEMRAVSLVR